ncbi:hypothetical protein RhiirA5_427655 [Rhizophagus irregularis]|uniref:Uncharacterized protein n=2 Tax=Rhizophagus irregularis TaxID=588596 RepID=A0A2N0P1W8_9GLOM|nr:hypothetical protein RhiirA5_427655 [Rhizophagus irregularis]CAG8462645.1 4509_t:CDS:2 [Rhizophagus irregularis]
MPFLVSVHRYFAIALIDVPSFWLVADNLAVDGLARLKVEWNRYLFEEVLPESPIDTHLKNLNYPM